MTAEIIPGSLVEHIMSGPCICCGATNYPLSMGGSGICPACDCGRFNGLALATHNAKLAARITSLEGELEEVRDRNRRLKEANDSEHRRLVASKNRQRERAIRAEQKNRELVSALSTFKQRASVEEMGPVFWHTLDWMGVPLSSEQADHLATALHAHLFPSEKNNG